MSAPRWSMTQYGYVIMRDGLPVTALDTDYRRLPSAELDALCRRIVALLNATELTPDAVATLQYACMSTASTEQDLADAFSPEPLDDSPFTADLVRERNLRLGTLNMLTVTLNHAARVYVELTEEPALKMEIPV